MSKLPDSWVETKLGDVIDYGTTIKVEPVDIPDDAWILELEDIEKDSSKILNRLTFAERKSKSTKNRFVEGDVLYGKLRPYLSKVILADADGYCTTEIIPIKPTVATDNRFVFYWLKHPAFLQYATEVSHGLSMPRLGTDAGRSAPFILAPLTEQKRIADKLDALLIRVAACRERLDRVPDILKHFRQSVFDAATSGQLTREWRDERGRLREEWQEPRVKDVVTIRNGRAFPSADYSSEGVRLLRPGNLHISGHVDWDSANTRRLPPRYARKFPDYVLRHGELVMNLTAQSLKDDFLGRVCLKTDDEPALLNQRICAFRPTIGWDIRPYLFLYFKSPRFRSFVDTLDSGTLIKHMHSRQLLEHDFPLPPQDEATEILARTRTLLAAGEHIERHLANAQALESRLTPALLAKAFRGEFVPQDPGDEPASELLARLKARQSNAAKPPRRRPKTQTERGKRRTMSHIDKDTVKAAILKLKTDRFTFEELRAQVSGDYDSLRDALFELLEEPSPVVRQVFDKKAQAMHLVRVRP